MLYQLIITAGLVGFLINLILNLRCLKTPRADSKVPEPAPLVSILVPARDEEVNIRACLESLQKQDYPNYEVLVLDDIGAAGLVGRGVRRHQHRGVRDEFDDVFVDQAADDPIVVHLVELLILEPADLSRPELVVDDRDRDGLLG